MNGIYVLVSEAEPNGFTAPAQWLTRFLSNKNVLLTSKPHKLDPETFRLMIAPESVMQLPLEAGRDDISDRDYHDNEELHYKTELKKRRQSRESRYNEMIRILVNHMIIILENQNELK
jgi:hypothetical protein